mmetsp:Transcript_18719/g.51417  ORF Transcript_18719/g.51417 Transcript_18719/m.51417 type:complete len:209 (-) Transcript_18719:128-754(-)
MHSIRTAARLSSVALRRPDGDKRLSFSLLLRLLFRHGLQRQVEAPRRRRVVVTSSAADIELRVRVVVEGIHAGHAFCLAARRRGDTVRVLSVGQYLALLVTNAHELFLVDQTISWRLWAPPFRVDVVPMARNNACDAHLVQLYTAMFNRATLESVVAVWELSFCECRTLRVAEAGVELLLVDADVPIVHAIIRVQIVGVGRRQAGVHQ